MLDGDQDARLRALNEHHSFSEMADLGTELQFRIDEGQPMECTVRVHGKDTIPNESYALLKSGKLSKKKITTSRFNELHQDHVVSCVLRIAREVFALLPEQMVLVTAVDELLNTATGHLEEHAILSVAVPRVTLKRLNLDRIDPSDALQNFIHSMSFTKTSGFAAVQRLDPGTIEADVGPVTRDGLGRTDTPRSDLFSSNQPPTRPLS